MAEENSKPIDPRCKLRARLAETDLRVEYHPHQYVAFIGTRSQLEAEGVTDLSGRWPESSDSVRWEAGGRHFMMYPEFRSKQRKLYGDVLEETRYRLRVEIGPFSLGALTRARLLEKLDEMEEIKRIGSREHHETIKKGSFARMDRWFQSHLVQLFGEALPRKGGRRRSVGQEKSHASHPEKA